MGTCSSKNPHNQEEPWAKHIHDIRGMLTPLSVSTQLLELTDLTIEQKKHILTIKNSTTKITEKLSSISGNIHNRPK